MAYYIGLSALSIDAGAAVNNGANSGGKGEGRKSLLSVEARRILPLFEGMPVNENSIAREKQGRPFFPGREFDFSISHSGSIAAVSYAGGGISRTGCDIEMIRYRPGAMGIANDFFSTDEKKYLFPGDVFDHARFYRIWTLKECFIKLRGLSVFDMAACPSFISDGAFAFGAAVSLPLLFCLYELSGSSGDRYMLAASIEGEQTRPQIRWFSQLSLDCKRIAEIKAAPNPAETVRPKM